VEEGLCKSGNFFALQKKSSRRGFKGGPTTRTFVLDLCDLSVSSFPVQRQFIANMFKPSNPMMMRLRLTTKQVNGGYYKGNRTGSMGHFDHKGNYVIDWKKVRTYVFPDDMENFKVGSLGLQIPPRPAAY
jgi:hypothetical protein